MNAASNKSLIHKLIVPHKVVKSLGSHAKGLDILESTIWHNVVHSTLLMLFRRRGKPQDMDEDEEEIWKVEEIVHARIVKRVAQYRVWWTGCTDLVGMRKTFAHLDTSLEKLQKSSQNFPRKPRDKKDI